MRLIVIIFLLFTTQVYAQEPVLVKWVDIIATDGGWRTYDEMLEWSTSQDTVKQIGFIIYQDTNKLILTDSYFDKTTIGYCVMIPKATIVEIVSLPGLNK